MDFALLGTGHETMPLLQAIVDDPTLRLIGFVVNDATTDQILRLAPAARRLGAPPELMAIAHLDAVIVDTVDSDALEAAKQLAGHSVAVLLVPRAEHGIEFIYQFGLIRDEQPDLFRLYPIRPARCHPLVVRLRDLIQSNALGRIHQLQWRREILVLDGLMPPCLLTKNQIDEALLADADMLKLWAGEFDQVTALQTGDVEQGLIQASVSLSGKEALPTQWSCRGTTSAPFWELTVTGELRRITLQGTDDPSTMTWSDSQSDQRHLPEIVTFDWGSAVLSEFVTGTRAGPAVTAQWANDLYRSFDLLEGAHRSLRRRRTVDLYFDTPSERGNFKSTMTAVGCSLLLLTLLTILMGLGAGAIAKDLKLDPIVMQVIRVLVFAPLFIFLFLQLGVFLAKPAATDAGTDKSSKDDPSA